MSEVRLKLGGREYEVPSSYTLGEARLIKQLTGQTLLEFQKQMATDATDPDGLAAIMLIALRRSGQQQATVDDLVDIKLEDIQFVGGDDETPTGAGDGVTSSPSSAPTRNESAVAS